MLQWAYLAVGGLAIGLARMEKDTKKWVLSQKLLRTIISSSYLYLNSKQMSGLGLKLSYS